MDSFPKMQKSSASFSQSVRNRLRLKKLQAQAKNFCRVLDIRVAKVMNSDSFYSSRLAAPGHFVVHIGLGDWKDSLIRLDSIKTGDVIFHFFGEKIWHLNIANTLRCLGIGDNILGSDFLIGLVYPKNILLKIKV